MPKSIINKLLFIFLIGLSSCGTSELKPASFINWIDDSENGLIKEYEQGDIKLTCQYIPSEYAVLKQNDPDKLDEKEINEEIKLLKDFVQFKLKFENTKSNNFLKDNYTTPEEFNTRSMYLSYAIQTDLKLVNGNDTIDCALNHHERTYGNTPYETLSISFSNTNKQIDNLELIFDDRVFGLGRVKFYFKKDILAEIPKLVLL